MSWIDDLRPVQIQRTLEKTLPKHFWEDISNYTYPKTPAHEIDVFSWHNLLGIDKIVSDNDLFWGSLIAHTYAAIAKWRMTKGVYRFDETLLQELVDTPAPDDAPCEVFLHLPEPCIWVDMRGFAGIDGYFAFSQFGQLTILVDLGIGILYPIIAVIEDRKLKEALAPYDNAEYGRFEVPINIRAIFSTLLYICSDEPDYGDKEPPIYHAPQPSKKGFMAKQKPAVWDVGVRIGATLKRSQQDTRSDTDRELTDKSVRPHLRRAHWHGYWIGPKNEPTQRWFIHKWIPPLLINAESYDADQAPTVIRRIADDSK